MQLKILFVDDDPNILAGYQRQLRKHFHLETAQGGEEGLQILGRNGPYAVVVSDLKMPSRPNKRPCRSKPPLRPRKRPGARSRRRAEIPLPRMSYSHDTCIAPRE